MGISITVINLLIELSRAGHLPKGSVMEIGAQQLSNNVLAAPERLKILGEAFGREETLTLPHPLPTDLSDGGWETLPSSAPPAKGMWEWLGYAYAAIDIDNTPGSI